jgi:hypothetical protein
MPEKGVTMLRARWISDVFLVGLGLTTAPAAWAHCDTLDGPVVTDARAALAAGKPDAVLKWVQPPFEAGVRAAFERVAKARTASPAARDVADAYFFETVVRLHRAGEGEPFTGIKPTSEIEPIIVVADAALTSGKSDALVKELQSGVAEGVQTRWAAASAAKVHREESIELGRKYVEAYVAYVHYVEALAAAADGGAAAADEHAHR